MKTDAKAAKGRKHHARHPIVMGIWVVSKESGNRVAELYFFPFFFKFPDIYMYFLISPYHTAA